MRDRQNKGDTVKLRIVAVEKQIIFSAAKRRDVSASEFIRQAALKASGQSYTNCRDNGTSGMTA